MQNARKRKDWREIWHFGASFHLNETARFGKNDVVSCVEKKKRWNGAVLRRHCFFFFFPWACSRGRKVLFSSPCLFLPRALKPKQDATCSSSWWEDREAVSCKRRPHWTSQPVLWQGGTAASHPMHSDGMGQGRSRSPCPYKYRPSAEDRGGEKERKKKAEKREKTAEKGGTVREKPTG